MSEANADNRNKRISDEQNANERIQIGPRVRRGIWQDFKDYAENRHGKQGMASEELERAMIQLMATDEDEEDESTEQLDVINAKLDSLLVAVNE